MQKGTAAPQTQHASSGPRATEQAASSAETVNTTPYNILHVLRSVRHEMSVKEVAALLRTSVDTVYRMVRRNEIPHMVLAGSLRFDPSVLELWLIRKEPLLAVAARQLAAAA